MCARVFVLPKIKGVTTSTWCAHTHKLCVCACVCVCVCARACVCARVFVLPKIKGVTTSMCVHDTGIVIATVFSSYCLFT